MAKAIDDGAAKGSDELRSKSFRSVLMGRNSDTGFHLRTVILLLALALLASGVRFFVLEKTSPMGLVGDEVHYMRVAENIAAGTGAHSNLHWRAWRPPGHPFAISLFLEGGVTSPGDMRRVLMFQLALGTIIVLLTALLGESLFDFRTGVTAGMIAALYPNFVAFSTYLWSENLYTVLLLSGLLSCWGS